jgi:hypothetical protein
MGTRGAQGKGMTTYDGDVALPGRHGPAFGDAPALPRTKDKEPETRGPLTKRAEAALGLAIVVPTTVGYAALAYGCYLAVRTLF